MVDQVRHRSVAQLGGVTVLFDDADDDAYPTEFIDEDDEFDVGLGWRYRGRARDVHRVTGSRSKRFEEEWPLADLSRDESKRLRAALAEEEFEAEKRRILGS